jgi:hypothetical protein
VGSVTDLDDDLFQPAEPAPLYGLNWNQSRYLYPPPPGIEARPGGWRRMTKVVSAFSDQDRLGLWQTWKALEGLRAHEVIFDEWMAEPLDHLSTAERNALANLYAEKARAAAKADEGARRGTARHEMMHAYLSTGEVTGTRSMRMQMDSALEALDAHDLEVIKTETKVWHPVAGGTMGGEDVEVMCRRTGQIGTFDWKTQARFWTFQEICGQLYGYDSAPFEWNGQGWIPRAPHTLRGVPDGEFAGKRVALVAHMPHAPGPGQLPVEIYEVDLEYGARVLAQAAGNIELRSIGKSVAAGRRVGVVRQL